MLADGFHRAKKAFSARADTPMKEYADEPAPFVRFTNFRDVVGGFQRGATSAYPDVAMWASGNMGMWRVGVVALPQFSKFILGKRDEGRAPDDAEGTNEAFTNRLEHLRIGDVQQACQLARAQECQVVAGSW